MVTQLHTGSYHKMLWSSLNWLKMLQYRIVYSVWDNSALNESSYNAWIPFTLTRRKRIVQVWVEAHRTQYWRSPRDQKAREVTVLQLTVRRCQIWHVAPSNTGITTEGRVTVELATSSITRTNTYAFLNKDASQQKRCFKKNVKNGIPTLN